MSKQLYIDEDKNILCTPVRLYNYSLETLDGIERIKDAGINYDTTGIYKTIIYRLSKALTFGVADSAGILAYLYCHGLDDKSDYTKVKLYIAIGNNLGSEICAKYMQGQNDDTLDIKEFFQTKPFYPQSLLNKATLYANAAKVNADHHGKNEVLTAEKIVEASNVFYCVDPDHILDNPIKLMDSKPAQSYSDCTLPNVQKAALKQLPPEPQKSAPDVGITGFFKNLFCSSSSEADSATKTTFTVINKMPLKIQPIQPVFKQLPPSAPIQKLQPKFILKDTVTSKLICDGHYFGQMKEDIVISTPPLTFSYKGQYVKITQFRSVILPDNTNPGKDCAKSLALKKPNGDNIAAIEEAYLCAHYNDKGKLIKLDIPNTPFIPKDPKFPVIVPYIVN